MLQPGQQIENYRIDGVIGEGGMGTIYRATDVNLMRPVAVKVMHGELAGDPAFQERFLHEARAAARLDHPSIVRIYHFGREGGLLYIVMELVDGLSLGAYLRQLAKLNQVVRLEETLSLVAQAADALGYAHRHGVIHRDVKPDNILVKRIDRPVRPGDPPLLAMVTDFGLAKLHEVDGDTTGGMMMGTLPYMSPEQVLDLPIDGRSDIYSLGVVLYQLATGRLPLDIRSPEHAIEAHQYELIAAPRAVNAGVPVAVEVVIMRALARRPENRYQSAEELAADLRRTAATIGDQEASVFATETDSAIVSLVTEFPTPSRRLEWDMQPREIRGEGICRVSLMNRTPFSQTANLTVETPRGGLYADNARKQVTLVPGQKGIVDFYLQPMKQPAVGRNRAWPFMVRVATDSSPDDAPGIDGQVIMTPRVPWWLAVLLPALFMTLCGLGLWLLISLPVVSDLLRSLGG
ncbi:MAG: protein kinase [Candidatus Promineofilum sp.]|nr:protein kinase [Promineifilum sp.]